MSRSGSLGRKRARALHRRARAPQRATHPHPWTHQPHPAPSPAVPPTSPPSLTAPFPSPTHRCSSLAPPPPRSIARPNRPRPPPRNHPLTRASRLVPSPLPRAALPRSTWRGGVEAHALCTWYGPTARLLGVQDNAPKCPEHSGPSSLPDKAWLPPDWRARLRISSGDGSSMLDRRFSRRHHTYGSGFFGGMVREPMRPSLCGPLSREVCCTRELYPGLGRRRGGG